MIITAIAARKRENTLEAALAPPSPRNRMMRPADEKMIQTMIIFTTKEIMVTGIPKISLNMINVVRAAGPAIKGVPIGTVPTAG